MAGRKKGKTTKLVHLTMALCWMAFIYKFLWEVEKQSKHIDLVELDAPEGGHPFI